MNTDIILHDLAWQIAIGADEAIAITPGLNQWQNNASIKPAPKTAPRPAPILSPAPTTNPIATPIAPRIVQAQNLDDLKQEISDFKDLPISQTAMNMVFADGNPLSKIMILGDVPGADEDRSGKPFSGDNGKLLDKMLAAINLTRHDVYLTNTFFWRPPGNRAPLENEILTCLPFTERHIALVNPKIIICLGGGAAHHLLGTKASINRLRGQWQDYKPRFDLTHSDTIPCLATHHPASLLTAPGNKRQTWADLLLLKHFIDDHQILASS